MEMLNIMSMLNIFLAVVALGLLIAGFRKYNDIPAYKNLGIGFVITLVVLILVQLHTVISPATREWYLKLGTTGYTMTAILFYFFIFKHKNINKMPNKKVAFFQENVSDIFVSYTDGSGTKSPNTVVSSLPTSPNYPTAPWFQDTDSNGIVDACVEIASGSASGTFKRSDNSTYTKNSVDFIGGRPPVRPH